MNTLHEKTWLERGERIKSIRANIDRGSFRLILERNVNGPQTARPLRKLTGRKS